VIGVQAVGVQRHQGGERPRADQLMENLDAAFSEM